MRGAKQSRGTNRIKHALSPTPPIQLNGAPPIPKPEAVSAACRVEVETRRSKTVLQNRPPTRNETKPKREPGE